MTELNGATLYANANVITMNPSRPRARGLRVEGDTVTHVFDELPEALTGRVIDLDGATILPGLVDAHFHLRSVGDVDSLCARRAVRLDDGVGGLLCRIAVDIGDYDMRALARERLADGTANAGATARYKRDFVVKPPHRSPLSVLAASISAAW